VASNPTPNLTAAGNAADTYIFVFDCDKKLRVAYPLKPEI